MTWLYEDPWTIVFLGTALAAIAGAILYQVSGRMALGTLLAIALLTGGLLLVERLVVTDMEQVQETLYSTADAFVENDLDTIMANISPQSQRLRQLVKHQLKIVNITVANISEPKIAINKLTSPPSATAMFTGRVSGRLKNDEAIQNSTVLKMTVKLVYQDQRWLIEGYQQR